MGSGLAGEDSSCVSPRSDPWRDSVNNIGNAPRSADLGGMAGSCQKGSLSTLTSSRVVSAQGSDHTLASPREIFI
ncbi:hypothetical protein SUGI_0855480 [Cryptomeria japonica]|nr:hypothetical protein SUGI_0855480 [Cryptomeria japonica]